MPNLAKSILAAALVGLAFVLLIPLPAARAIDIVLNPIGDTFIQSDAPNRNNGNAAQLEVRVIAPTQVSSVVLLKFDLSGIPQNSQIFSARLTLRTVSVDYGGLNVGSYFSFMTDWEELSAVWTNSQFALTPDGRNASSIVRVDRIADDFTFNVLSDIRSGVKAKLLTEILKPENLQETGRATFYSRKWVDKTLIPRLYVTYEAPPATTTESSVPATTIPVATAPATSSTSRGFEQSSAIVAGVIVLIAIVGFGLVFARRSGAISWDFPRWRNILTGRTLAKVSVQSAPSQTVPTVPRQVIPTGNAVLDDALNGGLPERTSLAIIGASSEKLESMLINFLKSNCQRGIWTIYCTTRELLSIGKMLVQYPNFIVMVCHSAADLMYQGKPRVFRSNLGPNDASIARAEIEKLIGNSLGPKAALMEIVSPLMLSRDAKTIRLWLSDFLEKLKHKEFSIIAHIDPSLHAKGDVAIVATVLDGELEIVEGKFIYVRRLADMEYKKGPIRIE